MTNDKKLLEGQTVRLTAITKDDLPRFVEWFADMELRRYLGGISMPIRQEDEDDWYEAQRKNPTQQNFAIRTLNATPWRYWRYPRGVTEQRKNFLYSGPTEFHNVSSCEPALQFKADPVVEQSKEKRAPTVQAAAAEEPAEGAGT